MQSFFPHSGIQAHGVAITMNIAEQRGAGERVLQRSAPEAHPPLPLHSSLARVRCMTPVTTKRQEVQSHCALRNGANQIYLANNMNNYFSSPYWWSDTFIILFFWFSVYNFFMNNVFGFHRYNKFFQYYWFESPLFVKNCVWFQVTDTKLEVLFCSLMKNLEGSPDMVPLISLDTQPFPGHFHL